MSGEVEFEAETEKRAVQKASEALNVEVGDLDYTVIDGGSGGLFGLGARPVKIRARRSAPPAEEASEPAEPEPEPEVPEAKPVAEKPVAAKPVAAKPATVAARADAEGDEDVDDDSAGSERASDRRGERREIKGIVGPAPEKAEEARSVAAVLAEKMGMTAEVTVRDEDEQIVVVIDEVEGSTDVADMLGANRPPAVPSFQFLLNKIVNRFPDNRKHIVVEAPTVAARVSEKRQARAERPQPPERKREIPDDVDPELAKLAMFLAARANEVGKVISIHPMSAGDRRALHQTIMTLDDAETVSDGEGLYRRLFIVPGALSEAKSTKKKRRRRRRRRKPEDGDASLLADGDAGSEGREAGGEDNGAGVPEADAPAAPDADAPAAAEAEAAPAEADAEAALSTTDADATEAEEAPAS